MNEIIDLIENQHIGGLIFDCDGTLADTMPLHFLAWRESLGRIGLKFDEDLFYSYAGQPTDFIISELSKDQGIEVDVPALTLEKEHAFLDRLSDVTPIQPVVDFAKKYSGKLPMGVGSGGLRDVVHQILGHLNVSDLFSAVVGAEDTQLHKPEPDVFLEVARRLGVDPSMCIVFEDADLGVEAAKRAGMRCFDVRAIHTPRRITVPSSSG